MARRQRELLHGLLQLFIWRSGAPAVFVELHSRDPCTGREMDNPGKVRSLVSSSELGSNYRYTDYVPPTSVSHRCSPITPRSP